MVHEGRCKGGEEEAAATAPHGAHLRTGSTVREVKGGESARQGELIESDDEVDQPEAHREVVGLQPGDVAGKWGSNNS